MITKAEEERRYKEARAKENYFEHILNEELAGLSQQLHNRGLKSGSFHWIYESFKGVIKISQKRGLKFEYGFKQEWQNYGLIGWLKLILAYFLAKISNLIYSRWDDQKDYQKQEDGK